MRKLALALALALTSLAGAAHAAGKGIVAPTTGSLKSYIANQNGRLVQKSTSPRSIYATFNKALAAKPSQFKKIKIFRGIDASETAYIPKVQIKGLKGNTAYVESFNLVNRDQLRTVKLPLF